MRKKRLCTMLAVLTAASVFAACGKTESTSGSDGAAGKTPVSGGAAADAEGTQETGEYDPDRKYEEPVTITGVLSYGPVTDPLNPKDTSPDNLSFISAAKEKYNIDFKWLWTAPGDQYDQKFGVAMVSGDLPDVMELTYKDFEVLRENDMLADWDEAVKYISPTTKEFLYKDGGKALESVTHDGKIMGIPQYFDNRREMNMMMIRQDWLDELGLKAPETTEELREVMKQFKEKKGASQPMAFDTDWGHGVDRLMQSFGAYKNAWIQKDGQLVNGNVQPEMKNALAYLNALYNDGLMMKDFAGYNTDKSTELLIAGKTGIIYGPWWFYEFSLNKVAEKDPAADWKAYAIPTAEGDVGKALVPRVAIQRIYAINKDCTNPEAIMKLMNMFVEGNETQEDWTRAENRYVWSWCVPKYFDPFDITTAFTKWNDQVKADPKFEKPLPADIFNGQNDEKVWAVYPDYMKWKDGDTSVTVDPVLFGTIMARHDPDGGWGSTLKVADSGKITYDEFYGTPTETMLEKQATLDKLTDETFLKIIMGEAPLEEFDNYADSWSKLGGADITEEVNEWYLQQ